MAVRLFRDDDRGYADWIAANPEGYVLNIQRSLNSRDARMHAASCRSLETSIREWESGRGRLAAQWVKLCGHSLNELNAWFAERGRDVGSPATAPSSPVARCQVCLPARPTVPPRSEVPARGGASTTGYQLSASLGEVTMKTPWRFPFEHLEPEQLQARKGLRTALASLAASEGQLLAALYSGPRPPNSDVENILFYNVDPGGASFVSASTSGVRFELDSQPIDQMTCQYQYRIVGAEEPLATWELGRRLTRFAGADLEHFTGQHRLAQVWMAVQSAPDRTYNPPPLTEGPFAVFLELEVPPGAGVGVRPEILKAVVDGVVCAFHNHLDEVTVTDVASRIANQIAVEPEVVAATLLAPDCAALGARPHLVRTRGQGVQWNPADERCVAGRLMRRPGERWELSGEIFEVSPARSSARKVSARVASLLRPLRRG